MTRPLLSVCVPAYNRSGELAPLLDSMLQQDFGEWECVISEDASPDRVAIRAVAERYMTRHPGRFRYFENEETLGYDGNFRRLVELARGEFVFIMGNDDLVYPGAFRAVAQAIARHPNIGVILRAFAVFEGHPDNIVQVTRYYGEECSFPKGASALLACYRRLVAMSGIVIHRESAHQAATSRWDGTLFYQHWLAGVVLKDRDAVYLPDLLAMFRRGGVPEFGNAAAERGLYTPGVQPPDTDVRMLRSLLEIAQAVGSLHGTDFRNAFQRDYARYMYPTIAHQAGASRSAFWRFYRDLGRLGFDRFLPFHLWFAAVTLLGTRVIDRTITLYRRTVGHTPNFTRAARPPTTLRRGTRSSPN